MLHKNQFALIYSQYHSFLCFCQAGLCSLPLKREAQTIKLKAEVHSMKGKAPVYCEQHLSKQNP